MKSEFQSLPVDGQTTLRTIADFLLSCRESIGISDSLLVRSVLVKIQDQKWLNYATTLFVSPQTNFRDKEADFHLGNLRLISHQSHMNELGEPILLKNLLGYWKKRIGEEGPEFHEGSDINRYARRKDCPTPCWVISLQENHPKPWEEAHPNAPQGPFFDAKNYFFAENVYDAAKEWLHDPFLRNGGTNRIDNQYHVIIPDHRAYFTGFSLRGDSLEVEIEVMEGLELFCCGKAYDYRRNGFPHSEPVIGKKAVLKLQGGVRALDLYLMSSSGEWLDRYSEGENYASWGSSVYYRDRLFEDPLFAELRLALESGESQHVEFKEWIPLARTPKSNELLKAAVAFTNSEGGNLYIGITDETKIMGIEHQLEKQYGKEHRADLQVMEDVYIKDLRKLLLEGIQPKISPVFEWIDHANHAVLRICFPPGEDQLYSMIETGDIYIRKNATNRKAYPAELQRMCSSERRLR